MYQEISRRDKVSFIHLAGSILLLVIVLFAFNGIVSMLSLDNTLLDLAWLFIAVIFTYQYIKRNIISYKYMIIEDEFIIQEMIGSKEKPVLNINVHQITASGNLDSASYEEIKREKYKSKRKLYNGGKKIGKSYLVYEDDEERYLVIIQPTKKMKTILEKRSNLGKDK